MVYQLWSTDTCAPSVSGVWMYDPIHVHRVLYHDHDRQLTSSHIAKLYTFRVRYRLWLHVLCRKTCVPVVPCIFFFTHDAIVVCVIFFGHSVHAQGHMTHAV